MIEIFLQYGIAGLILFVFYKLFSNELKHLKYTINKLEQSINYNFNRLYNQLDKLNESLNKLSEKIK